MGIYRYMVAIKATFSVLLVLLLVVAAVRFVDKKGTQEDFVRELFDPASELLDDDTAKVLWTCWENLVHSEKEIENLDFCLQQKLLISSSKIGSEIQSLVQAEFLKLISVCHSQFKENFVHCLKKINFPLLVSGEEDDNSKIWHVLYTGLHLSRSSTPKRNMGRVLLHRIPGTPSPVPADGSPTPSLSPSPGSSLAPSPRTSLAPSPGPSLAPSSAPAPVVPRSLHPSVPSSSFFPKLTPPAAADVSAPPSSDPNKPEDKHSNKRTVVIAVVITALVTSIGAALLFLFCSQHSKTGRFRKNDERPLLSLSMSDYSVGPSSFAFGNSIKGEKHGFQSSSNNLVDRKKTSVQESQSLGTLGAAVGSTLELKASSLWAGTMHPEMPPLKPPPGRLNPLPPEPPSFRPSGNAAASSGPQQLGVGGTPPPGPPPSTPPISAVAKPSPPPPPRPPAPAATKPSPPPPPPALAGAKSGPRPPPPPKGGVAPPRPPPPIGARPSVIRPSAAENVEAGAPKAKLKPFFWDKVQANPDQSMVWNQIKSGSFQFNEEMIETLFGAADKNNGQRLKESSSQDYSPQYIQIIDKKRAQNLLILLRALNVTMEEVCDALYEGNELPSEFLQTLLKMAPTSDEELKLRLFSGDISQLGPADQFLKALVDIPFAFKRMEALLFMSTLKEELNSTLESFETLEVACKELRNSRLFLKLLEAVLKTGNRMNDGTFRGGAQAFKLDTLLKLSDVKGTDGKTTLLHFVVQEIIRSEGIKAARAAKESQSSSDIKTDVLFKEISKGTEDYYPEIGLQVVSRLSSELENVKKAAVLDADSLTGNVAKLGHGLIKTKDLVNRDPKNAEEDRGFHETMKNFVQDVEADVMKLLEDEKRVMALVKSTGDYFHGKAGKDEGLRLFVTVRDFLIMLDKACKEVRDSQNKPAKTQKQEISQGSSSMSSETRPPLSDFRQRLFPSIAERRIGDSSSDDESP